LPAPGACLYRSPALQEPGGRGAIDTDGGARDEPGPLIGIGVSVTIARLVPAMQCGRGLATGLASGPLIVAAPILLVVG